MATLPDAVRTTLVAAPAPGRAPQMVAFFVMVGFFAVAPFFVYPMFLMKVLCFALFACAFNLLIGYVGLLSFGHAVYLGAAGYAAAHAAKAWGWPPELAVLGATAVAAGLGLVIGAIAIRRQGIYFAMTTLALAQMIYFFCLQAPFTGGEDGIQAVPRGVLFGLIDLRQPAAMYAVVFAVFLAGFAVVYRTIHSPFGQVLTAIRENEPRALSLGYQADHYKLIAFVLSAALSGLAGATKVIVFQLASLTDVHWSMSGEVVLMTLLGGLGTVFGPVAGALFVVTLEHYLAQLVVLMTLFGGLGTGFGPVAGALFVVILKPYLAQLGAWVTVAQGVIFVVCVLTVRRGVVGELARVLGKRL